MVGVMVSNGGGAMRAIRVNWASPCARSMGSQYERLSACVAEISTFNVQPVCTRRWVTKTDYRRIESKGRKARGLDDIKDPR